MTIVKLWSNSEITKVIPYITVRAFPAHQWCLYLNRSSCLWGKLIPVNDYEKIDRQISTFSCEKKKYFFKPWTESTDINFNFYWTMKSVAKTTDINHFILQERILVWARMIYHGTRLTDWDLSVYIIYVCRWIGSSLVKVMAWRLFGPKPLPKPTLTYCQLDHRTSFKLESKYEYFLSRKFANIYRLQYGGHFVSVSNC